MAIGLLPTRARSDCTSFFFLFFIYGTEDVPPFFTSISIDGSTESIRGKTAIYCISVALYGYLMRPDIGRRTLKMVISRLDEFQIRFKTSFGGITFSFFFSVTFKEIRCCEKGVTFTISSNSWFHSTSSLLLLQNVFSYILVVFFKVIPAAFSQVILSYWLQKRECWETYRRWL